MNKKKFVSFLELSIFIFDYIANYDVMFTNLQDPCRKIHLSLEIYD